MDFDSWKTSFDNCEARYIRRTVGNALNECLAELLCVRPTDPIEYMGHWLHHYAGRRNYFKKKKTFYENLLATKIDMENKRMNLIQKHNEAVIDITKPLLQLHKKTTDSGRELSSTTASAVDTASGARKSSSAGSKLTVTENMYSHDSDISDNSSLMRSDSIQYTARSELVVKKSHDLKATSDKSLIKASDKSRQGKAGGSKNQIAITPSNLSKSRRHKKKSSNTEAEDDDRNSATMSSETLLNTHYLESWRRRSSVEPIRAKWKVKGNQIICFHPVLGAMSIQRKRSKSVRPIQIVADFKAESMYDPELYTFDLDASEISSTELLLSDSEIGEEEMKLPIDFSEVGFFE